MRLLDLFKKKKPKEPIQCHSVFKLAGVTFENEDGTSRQKILKSLKEHDDLKVEKYKYNGEDAIKVLTLDNQCIGNIKAKDVPYVLELIDDAFRYELFDLHSFTNDEFKQTWIASVVVHYWKNPQKKD